jgi:asparagine synthase (glutamine-hydrolysing)
LKLPSPIDAIAQDSKTKKKPVGEKMCGICGYLDMSGVRTDDRDVLLGMTETIVHRGPDSSGYYMKENVGLGFRRLSLIDLEGGHQPLYNEDNSIVLLCNGEIYNYLELRQHLVKKGHAFRTNCDVEVLPHLYEEYGLDFFDKLNGQFAFALYDEKEQRLILARDHFGICPLFYAVAGGTFIFGSEIKAILTHPAVERAVDLTGLDQILTFPGVVSPRTMFKNISSLKSGHYMIVKKDGIRIEEYWDLNYPRAGDIEYDKPERYYVEKLEHILIESVKCRLHADVPVGLYLSGGLDSSLVAAIAKKLYPNSEMQSFSITFRDEELCESKYQRKIASQIGSTHNETLFDWHEISIRLASAVYHSETPLKETYNTASLALSEAAKRNGISAILTGEGADELFAGYVGYRFDRHRRQNKHSQEDSFDFERLLENELRLKLWGDEDIFFETDLYTFAEIKRALYSSTANNLLPEFDCVNFDLVNKERLRDRHFIHQRSYLDFKLRLADHLISDHGDRMTLASSVEGRYPFLDIGVAEFAREIPPDLKLNGFVEKYILKKIAERFVPPEISKREKYAFLAPGSTYLLKQNIEWVNDLLSFDQIKRQGYFNPETIEILKQKYTQEGFKLNLPFEPDLLIIVLTFGIFLDAFKMPCLN